MLNTDRKRLVATRDFYRSAREACLSEPSDSALQAAEDKAWDDLWSLAAEAYLGESGFRAVGYTADELAEALNIQGTPGKRQQVVRHNIKKPLKGRKKIVPRSGRDIFDL